MQIPDFIRERRSIREFLTKDLPDGAEDLILEAAIMAPSAGNRQPWEFVIVRDAEKKRRLVQAAHGQSFIAKAPIVFVVCVDPGRSASRYGRRGSELYCLQDTAAAIQNILLTAQANGFGSCWTGAFDEGAVAEVVNAPRGIRPVAIVPVGYPRGVSFQPSKRSLEEVVHRESF